MNKKGNLLNIVPIIVGFSLLAIVTLTIYLLNYGIINDYMLVNLQNITEDLANQSLVVDQLPIHTQEWASSYSRIPTYFDGAFAGIYIIFFLSTIIFAYLTKPTNYFGFFAVLFYGLMFILFLSYLVITLTDWWKTEILDVLIPNWYLTTPIFNFFMEHTGVFVLVQLLVCMLVNLFDIDLSKINQRKRKEQAEMQDEVL